MLQVFTFDIRTRPVCASRSLILIPSRRGRVGERETEDETERFLGCFLTLPYPFVSPSLASPQPRP